MRKNFNRMSLETCNFTNRRFIYPAIINIHRVCFIYLYFFIISERERERERVKYMKVLFYSLANSLLQIFKTNRQKHTEPIAA